MRPCNLCNIEREVNCKVVIESKSNLTLFLSAREMLVSMRKVCLSTWHHHSVWVIHDTELLQKSSAFHPNKTSLTALKKL